MPVILGDDSLERWLSPTEVDPRDLTVPFPSAELRVWRVSSRVNNVADDDPAVLEPSDEMVEYGGGVRGNATKGGHSSPLRGMPPSLSAAPLGQGSPSRGGLAPVSRSRPPALSSRSCTSTFCWG